MSVPGYRDHPAPPWDPVAPADPAEAEDFLRQCYTENPRLGPVEARLAIVGAQIAATGTYVHTVEEVSYGAKMAWRNASRCIGRLYWRSLTVLDRRRARTADEIFALLVHHLRAAGDTGIRPVISVFAAATPGQPFARVWNEQLIRYAGYRDESGCPVGDQRQVGFTAAMQQLNWIGKGEPFDILPVAIETPAEGVRLYELPERAIREVRLSHPEFGWFAHLDLRWHAVPAIANMRLVIGGVHYPLAPFNGWYMGTEIGARNLADADRYDMLPVVADRLGLDTSRESTLWRDRALVELNRAVLWSFERAGVKMTDHHTESQRFLTHVETEAKAGRMVPADWSWIVPPMSGALTPVYHRYYEEADLRPAFYLDPEAQARAAGGTCRARPTNPDHPDGAHQPSGTRPEG